MNERSSEGDLLKRTMTNGEPPGDVLSFKALSNRGRKHLLLASRPADAYLTIGLEVRWGLHGKGEPARLCPLRDLETCVQLIARQLVAEEVSWHALCLWLVGLAAPNVSICASNG